MNQIEIKMLKHFNKKIIEFLNSKNMSKINFCRKAGIDNSLLSHYLAEKNFPSMKNLIKIIKAHKLSLDWLFGLK